MNNHKTAIMIDGAYFLKQLKHKIPDLIQEDPTNVAIIANIIHEHSLSHTNQKKGKKVDNKAIFESYDLYRIFFYDCAPFEKKMHKPISGHSIDFSKTPQAIFRRNLHQELLKKRKVALRLGHLIDTSPWRIKSIYQTEIAQKKLHTNDLTDDHFEIDVKQKGVDMRLGLDVAALSYKKLVDQIILIVGDSDFVPAAKIARREGIDIIIDSIGRNIHKGLFEHTDGVKSPPIKDPRKRKKRN